MEYGIDISHWQGTVDFDRINKDFVIMKLSQKTHKDVKFDEYYSECTKRNIPVGCYIYNKVTTVADAKAEAEAAVKFLSGKKITCGVWLDLEDATMKNLPNLMELINTEGKILIDAGFVVGIYCNKYWYTSVLDSDTLADKYPFWVARYPSADNGTMKDSLSVQNLRGCVMWQYSSKGSVGGIRGNCDLDYAYTNLEKLTNENASVMIAKPELKLGDNGSEVKILQSNLNQFGYRLRIDGDFGQKTESALIDWQTKHKVGTIYDGIYGRKSAAKMEELLK